MGIRLKMNACVLAIAMLGAPLAASAAGFGKMTVLSNLGQPLSAEIDLVSVQPEEAQSLAVRLASMDIYQERGVDYNSYVRSLRFQLMRRDSGSFYVRVSSAQPINDAYIDFLVELTWAGGRIVRQYTDLLDPPDYKPAAGTRAAVVDVPKTEARPARKPVAVQPAAQEPASGESAIKQKRAPRKAAAKPAAQAPAPAAAPTAAPKSEPTAGDNSTHKVRNGETLGQIAGRYKPSGVSLDQMLYSLYKNNNDAFLNQNINRLKSGAILRIPARDQVASVSRDQAAAEIKAHATDWNGYKEKAAAAVASTPVRTAAPQTSTAGKITARTEDKAPTSAGPRDVVKLSKGDAAAANASAASQQRIRTLEEENAARARALQDANERVALLEKNVRDMQRLLEIKSKAGADLQKQADAKGKPAEAQVKTAQVAPAASKPVAAPVTPAPVKSAATPAPTVASAPAASPAHAASAPATVAASAPQAVASAPAASAPVEKKPKPERKPIEIEEPPEPSFMEENGPLLGGGVLGLGLLGGALFYFMRKRRARPTFEDSVLTGGDLKSNTVLGSVGASIVDTSNTTDNSFFTDFSREGLGSIDTDEVDPVAEAEVYMAYGRDAQAEEILKDALIKDSSRQEVRLKLMEIYAGRKNVANFEMYALELHAATNGAGPLWSKAAAMGRDLDPANQLYQDGAASVAAPVEEEPSLASLVTDPEEVAAPVPEMDLDFEIGTVKMEAPVLAAAPVAEAEPEAPADVDFDLGAIGGAPETEAAAEPSGLDFDFSSTASMPAAAPVVEPVKEEAPILDFHFDLGDMGAAAAPLEETVRMNVPTLSEPAPVEAAPAPADVLEEDASTEAGDMPLNFNFGDLDLNLDKPAAPEVEEVAAMPALDAMTDLGADTAALSFSLDDLEGQGSAAVEDPIETKLDLAKAYLEMGDSEGAREILTEAAAEGTEDQRKRAESMLAGI